MRVYAEEHKMGGLLLWEACGIPQMNVIIGNRCETVLYHHPFWFVYISR